MSPSFKKFEHLDIQITLNAKAVPMKQKHFDHSSDEDMSEESELSNDDDVSRPSIVY
jgi:hypothetical protein